MSIAMATRTADGCQASQHPTIRQGRSIHSKPTAAHVGSSILTQEWLLFEPLPVAQVWVIWLV